MSYLALARKWRPRQFADVMGQAPVVQALTHALDQDRLHPAILLTGTRGVGKTTLARIVAKGLNCDTGVSSQPCGVCSACREIDEGRSVDMLEIDAASNTGVDNIREIIENSQYAPVRSRYKVYLIDEVHMLSKGAFNALLKTLEEPPPHVKFVLATTDPQKLPITVLSRCLQFGLRRLTVALIREQLARVTEAEGIQAEAGALLAVARSADGSMRDALSLLDQAIAYAGGALLQAEAVVAQLGEVSRGALWPLLSALFADDRPALAAQLDRLAALAPDFAALLDELVAVLQRMAMLQLLPDSRRDDDEVELLALLDRVQPDELQLCYQIAVTGRRDLAWAPEPRIGFEMTVLRLLAFRPGDTDVGSPPAGPATGGGLRRPIPAATVPAPAAQRVAPAVPAAAPVAMSPPPPPPPPPPPAPAPAPAKAAAPTIQADRSPQAEAWAQLVERLGLDGFVKGLARNCGLREDEGTVLRLALEPKAGHLLNDSRRQALAEAVSRVRGEPVAIEISLAAGPVEDCPACLEAEAAAARQAHAEQALQTDAAVEAMRQQFGASLRPGSVQPPA